MSIFFPGGQIRDSPTPPSRPRHPFQVACVVYKVELFFSL